VGDVNNVGISMHTFEEIYRQLEEHTKTIGLIINSVETKVIIPSVCDSRHQQREIQDIEAVVSFTYLGAELTRENKEELILQ
jgi:hypothetical protein